MRHLRLLAAVLLLIGYADAGLAAEESKYDSLKRFSQVLDLVERHYVRDTPRKDLLNGAIKGMLQGPLQDGVEKIADALAQVHYE